MLIAVSSVALLCCVVCISGTINKSATNFEKVLHSIMAVIFLILSAAFQIGGV